MMLLTDRIGQSKVNRESPLNTGMYTVAFQIPVSIKMLGYSKSRVTFGAKLKAKRLEAGYSLKEFSKTPGVSETSVIAWEKHNVMPFEKNVKKSYDFFWGKMNTSPSPIKFVKFVQFVAKISLSLIPSQAG